MDADVNKLKDEITKLKEKLKNKNERIKAINVANKILKDRLERDRIYKHMAHIKFDLAEKITRNLDIGVYDVNYEYEGKIYLEKKVESESIKWIRLNLILSLAKRHKLVIAEYEIKIFEIKKLW